jgi:hypothetical protein
MKVGTLSSGKMVLNPLITPTDSSVLLLVLAAFLRLNLLVMKSSLMKTSPRPVKLSSTLEELKLISLLSLMIVKRLPYLLLSPLDSVQLRETLRSLLLELASLLLRPLKFFSIAALVPLQLKLILLSLALLLTSLSLLKTLSFRSISPVLEPLLLKDFYSATSLFGPTQTPGLISYLSRESLSLSPRDYNSSWTLTLLLSLKLLLLKVLSLSLPMPTPTTNVALMLITFMLKEVSSKLELKNSLTPLSSLSLCTLVFLTLTFLFTEIRYSELDSVNLRCTVSLELLFGPASMSPLKLVLILSHLWKKLTGLLENGSLLPLPLSKEEIVISV